VGLAQTSREVNYPNKQWSNQNKHYCSEMENLNLHENESDPYKRNIRANLPSCAISLICKNKDKGKDHV